MKYILGFIAALVISILASMSIFIWVMIYFLWEFNFKGALKLRVTLFNRLIEQTEEGFTESDMELMVKAFAYCVIGIVLISIMLHF